ncbi:MAG: DHA1 family inner membrane transport protein [Halieaceae bacterium]|jgi:DHA1 family inner membrane transport protein
MTGVSSAPNLAANGSHIRTLVSCTACWFLAQMSYYAQAQMLGPLMSSYDLSEFEIGLMFTKELTAYALAALFVAGPLSRISRVKAAAVGGVLLIIANLVSANTDSFEVLRITRLLAGFAGGLMGAAGTASAASSLNPQRIFAIVGVCWGLIAAVQLMVVPYLTVPYGAVGGYYGMAAAVVLVLPMILWLNPPRHHEAVPMSEVFKQNLSVWARVTERLGVRDAPNGRFAIMVMVALFVYEIGQGATQVFLEQFGLRTGLKEFAIGQILGVTGFVGLLGGVLAAWLGTRFGNLRPIVIGIIFNTFFASALALGTSAALFGANYLGWNIGYYFLIPYIMGVLAEMDDRGRWAVATEAVWWLGAAPGAAVGGLVVAKGGYSALAFLAPMTGFICLLILVHTLRRFNAIQKLSAPQKPLEIPDHE